MTSSVLEHPRGSLIIESMDHKDCELKAWDMGPSYDKVQPLWRKHYDRTHGLIFVVDSTGSAFEGERESLRNLLKEEALANVPLLILANKQDLGYSRAVDEISKALDLEKTVGSRRRWCMRGCSAKTGSGISEALE
uniref:Uncharacterized protein n=1 Tax=Lotharella oceanica TaxID=641309 RepID=A0A7S2TNN7_9EUKA|eukprot:CAMPEP_0170190746 /NCGR_PEP_ID=MMETSP0040_2-20121228/50029_1 /TAXON_ID=641309 /ORGANISM="Lotharella oceanica, Strain CCMP622" /LENGTH=135 /DNA_ID=CAMNT_0010438683 /DNA_START=22 /DNA_END=429 /DNA_ORIENTATION=-